MSEPIDPLCGAVLEHCLCTLPNDGHDVHDCKGASALGSRCLGQWRDDGTMVRYPTGAATEAQAAADVALLKSGNSAALRGLVAERIAAPSSSLLVTGDGDTR